MAVREGGAEDRPLKRSRLPSSLSGVEALALLYLAVPSVVFVAGWIVRPLGPLVAAALVVATGATVARSSARATPPVERGPSLLSVIAIATLWCLMAGLGHFVYANTDWSVRDAVLLDLVRDPWPVTYTIDGVASLLRAPIGFFLPAALAGRLWGARAAELALLAWTVCGVALVFATMLRDRPPLRAALVRLAVFIAFSGMDILGQIAHYNPHTIGTHLEWWAYLFQYSSQTTQLFWVPNHALPGWLAIAWLLGQDARRVPVTPAILFVVFTPLWSPLTAIGIAPIVGAALLQRFTGESPLAAARSLLDWRMLVPASACVLLVYPYLVAGSDKVAAGTSADLPWVGEDIVPRYIEFVLFEFVGFALLLVRRTPRDPVLWAAIAVLLVLPCFRFGPANDLAMRASIPALTLLAIRTGAWLSTPFATTRDPRTRAIAIALLAVGAVTPFMEFARVFIEPRWPMNDRASVPEVTRAFHYLTPSAQPWLERFMRKPDGP